MIGISRLTRFSSPKSRLAVMFTLNFPRHFAYLFVAALVLIFTQSGSTPHWIDRAPFLFALIGFLHAAALALALSKPHAFVRRILFIAITAAFSAIVPFVGAYIVSHLHLDGGLGSFALYAVSSGFGAAAYWVLVRLFWFRSLNPRRCLRTRTAIAGIRNEFGAGAQ